MIPFQCMGMAIKLWTPYDRVSLFEVFAFLFSLMVVKIIISCKCSI